MKRLLLAALVACLLAPAARACDICGCGVSYYNPYLFPHLSKSYVGLSYFHRVYRTAGHDGAWSRERYNTVLLTLQYSVGRKLQLQALLPWQANSLRNDAGSRSLSGLGDVSLMAQYRLWERNSDKGVRQSVLLGGGVKLASGRYVAAATSKAEDQNFQLGTGSTDLLLNGSYRISLRRWTFSGVGAYKYNTANKDGYRYGDVVNGGVQAAFRQEWRNWSLTPYAQYNYEWQLNDADNHVLQSVSGGGVSYLAGGLDCNNKRFAIGVNYQVTLAQDLAGGQIRVEPRLALRTSISF
ncbi:MAG: transporter [Chitinophagaceae bacterium]|nr:MAG: transporter [Chitinophagaceae bacterium]